MSVLLQESGKHGGEAAGPVVRDVIKAYYDKKNKKTQGQYTAESKPPEPHARTIPAAITTPRVVLKREQAEPAATASVQPTAEREP